MSHTPRLRPVVACLLPLPLFFACTNEENLGDRQGPPSDATWSGTAQGTIGGRAFTPASAYAHYDPNGYVGGESGVPVIHLIFSSAPDACSTTQANEVTPGATYVQIYHVPAKIASGTSTDAKAAVIDPSCVSGAALNASYASAVSSAGASVELTRLDGTLVEGSVSMTLEDGSSFAGTFSVTPCSEHLDEDFRCR